MATGSYNAALSIGGLTISSTVAISSGGTVTAEESLPVGKSGTLSTRTDNDTGVATLSTGHGIVTSDVVDVHWDGGVRYGMTATVATNDVSVDGGAGDNLPVATTAVVVTKQVQVDLTFNADPVAIGIMGQVATGSTGTGHVAFYDSSDALVAAFDLTGNVLIYQNEDLNDFASDVAHAKATNGSSSVAMTLQVAVAQDV